MQGPGLTFSIKHSARADAAYIEDCGRSIGGRPCFLIAGASTRPVVSLR
jgi:hypothetical protein